MHPTLDALISIAESAEGHISMSQARAAGARPYQISRWVKQGVLERMGPSALRFRGHPPPWRLQLRAALTGAGPRAVVSHRSAACLHELEGFGPGPVDVTVSRALRNRTAGPGTLHSTLTLRPIDRTEVDGLPCTSAVRTIIDLASCCEPAELERAVDSAIRSGRISSAYLIRRVEALRGSGRSGIRMLDDLLLDIGATNRLERRFLQLCRKSQLPTPRCQVVHKLGNQTVARVDFDFAPSALVVEVEGQVGHASPTQRQRDAARRRELHRLGRVVYPFTYEDVFHHPKEVVDAVRRAL